MSQPSTQAERLAARTRAAQGLPRYVADEAILRALAARVRPTNGMPAITASRSLVVGDTRDDQEAA